MLDAPPESRLRLRLLPCAVLAGYWVALAVATHLPGLKLGVPRPDLIRLDHLNHFAAFGLLMALVLWARPAPRAIGDRVFRLMALLVVLGYAAVDEYSQRWLDRVPAWDDYGANVAGVLSVYLVASMPSGLTRWPRAMVTLARSVWLAVVPMATMLVVMPGGNKLVGWLQREVGLGHRGADKDGHFYLAMLFTWLLALSCPGTRSKPRLSAALTIAVMVISAPAIEWVQMLTESFSRRRAEAADVQAHYAGMLYAMIGWAALVALFAPLWNRVLDWRGVPTLQQQHRATLARKFDPSTDARFVKHAAVVSGLTLLSRLTGLVRDATLAAVFGLGYVADAFAVGFLIPNLFRRLFGEGALSAAFIPHYSDLLRKDPQLARRFASLCVALLVVVLSLITVVGQFVLEAMRASGGWDERGELSIRLVMLMLPYMPMVCVVALLGGLLQVHRKFGPAAVAPILLNTTIVVFALWAAAGIAGDAQQPLALMSDGAKQSVAFIAGGAVLVAGLIQVGFLLIAAQRTTKLTYRFSGAGPTLWKMLAMMVPMVLGLAVFQINALLDVMIAMWLSPGDPGGVPARPILGVFEQYPMRLGDIAALGWAQRLYQFPLGVFGIAIATAIFPALSGAVRNHPDTGRTEPGDPFAHTLRQGLRLTVFIGLPASVGLILVRDPLARLIYEHGSFTQSDARRVGTILLGYAPAIWAYSMTHVLTRAFHALKDARTPLIVSLVMVVLNLGLNMTLVWSLGAMGLATSTAITAAVQSLVLITLARRRVERPIDGSVLKSWARTAGASAVMGLALGVPMLFYGIREAGAALNAVLLAGMVVGGTGVYLIASKFMGCEELGWLRKRR